jgi:hypothetical protein
VPNDYSVFGQLSQMNPLGSTKNSKEGPVDKDARRRLKGKKKELEKEEGEEEDLELEEGTESSKDNPPVVKVGDITI